MGILILFAIGLGLAVLSLLDRREDRMNGYRAWKIDQVSHYYHNIK